MLQPLFVNWMKKESDIMFTEKIITKTGYIECTIPFVQFNELLTNINNRKDITKANYRLAGQIENEQDLEIELIPDSLKKIIKEGCTQYINTFGLRKTHKRPANSYDLKFETSWINFQKKGEYNPIHHHSGDLVFVIWLKIPYNLDDEYRHPSSVNANNKVASIFQFANINNPFSYEVENEICVDKTYEGKMIIFSADMEHTVYPFFTSDEYRISMSGNLLVDLK